MICQSLVLSKRVQYSRPSRSSSLFALRWSAIVQGLAADLHPHSSFAMEEVSSQIRWFLFRRQPNSSLIGGRSTHFSCVQQLLDASLLESVEPLGGHKCPRWPACP
eukprot:6172578-Pleurochrysis_carterae.AAC.3